MAKAKKKKNKTQDIVPFWKSGFSELDRVFDNFKRDFERAFSTFPTFSMPAMPKMPSTSCDIVDEGNELLVNVDVPGVKKNEINLNVTDNSIEISAEHKEEEEEKKKNFLRKERSQVSYYRTLPLPEKVISNKAKAKLTDGVLSITIPKATPTPKPKKRNIQIQ